MNDLLFCSNCFHSCKKCIMTGKEARAKGHNYELAIIHILRELGFNAVSSRSESKNLDDSGVDIFTDAPYNIQCKSVERLGNLHKVIKDMPTDKTPVVFHKRNRQGTIVAIKLEDFIELIKPLDKIYE